MGTAPVPQQSPSPKHQRLSHAAVLPEVLSADRRWRTALPRSPRSPGRWRSASCGTSWQAARVAPSSLRLLRNWLMLSQTWRHLSGCAEKWP
jgi:hypothetical protein